MHQVDYTKEMQIVTHRVLNLLHLNGLGKVQDYFTLQRYSTLRLIIHLIIHLTIESIPE